jgi:hypothetical protein
MAEGTDGAGGPRWQPGSLIVLRYITTRDGRPGASWPCRVVADRDDLLALYIADGTIFKEWQPAPSAPDRRLADTRWRADVLRLMFPGRWHSVWLSWLPEEGGRFRGYYVNFEEPFRRTPIGFDTNDHTLDIVVAPDLAWRWKDEEDFAGRIEQGIYSAELAAEVRAEAQRVIAAIEACRFPFSGEWEGWRPDPSWEMPRLPLAWDTEPVALWERRPWAYPVAR